MQTFSCDICRRKLDNPINDRTFFYMVNHSICEPCKDILELQVKSAVRNNDPFTMDWYVKHVRDSLEKAVQKGKI